MSVIKVIKEMGMGPSGAPTDLDANLALAPTCSGVLMKCIGPSSASDQWKSWLFELRGVYLCYFKVDEAIVRGRGTTSPQGVVDLRRISNAITNDSVLILTSEARELHFKAVPDGAAIFTATALDEWARCIANVLSSESGAYITSKPSTMDADIVLSDIYGDGFEMTAQDRAINPIHSVIDLRPGLASSNLEASLKLPTILRYACVYCGILRGGQGNISYAYRWAVRAVVVSFFLVYSVNMIYAVAFGPTRSQIALGIPEGVDESCSRSFISDDDSNSIPCLLTASYIIVSCASGLTNVYLYLYLLFYIDEGLLSLLNGQYGEIISKEIEKLTYVATFIFFAMLVPLAGVFSYLATVAVYGENIPTSIMLSSVLMAVFRGIITSLAILPAYVFSILYYAESRRLQMNLSEFSLSLKNRPFVFYRLGPRYLDVVDSWKEVKRRFDCTASVAVGGWLATLGACYVISAYTFWFDQTTFFAVGASIFVLNTSLELLPPFVLLVYGTIRVNDMMEPIINMCYVIMACPNRPSPMQAQFLEDGLISSDDHHKSSEDQSSGAMKLALLVKKMPCTLLLFGWKVSWSAVLTTIAAVLFSQGIGAVGLRN